MRGRWAGALIEGPSGSGKSDLALRAMSAGWRLVADDRVIAWRSGGRLFGRAPATLSGLIEARGLGVIPVPPLAYAEIVLAVACVQVLAERLPDPLTRALLEVASPLIALNPREASSLAKLTAALEGALDDAGFRSGGGRRI